MSRISIGHGGAHGIEASSSITSHDGASVPITLWNARQDFFPEPILYSRANAIPSVTLGSTDDKSYVIQNVQLGKMTVLWHDGSSSIYRADRSGRRLSWVISSGGSAVLSASAGAAITGAMDVVPLNDGYAIFWKELNSGQYKVYGARFDPTGVLRARAFQVAGPYGTQPVFASAKRPQGMVIVIAHGSSLSGFEWNFSQDVKVFDRTGFGYPYKRTAFSLSPGSPVVALSISDLSFTNTTTRDFVYAQTGSGTNSLTKFAVVEISSAGALRVRVVQKTASSYTETDAVSLDNGLDGNSRIDTCALDGGVGFAVVYDKDSGAGDRDVYASVVNADRQVIINPSRINNGTSGDQKWPTVAPVMSGFLVAWYSSDVQDIVLRRVEASAADGASSAFSFFGVPLNYRSDVDLFDGSIVGANIQGVRPTTLFKEALHRDNEVLLTYTGATSIGSVGTSAVRPRVVFLPDGMISVVFRQGTSLQEILLRESAAKCYTGNRATPALFLRRNAFACATLPKFDKDVEQIAFTLDGVEVTNTSFYVQYYGRCPAGSYCPDHRRHASTSIISCSPGHHCPHNDMFEQLICAPGTYQYASEFFPIPCPPGYYCAESTMTSSFAVALYLFHWRCR